MKYITYVIVFGIILGGMYFVSNRPVSYVAPEKEIVIEEKIVVTPDPLNELYAKREAELEEMYRKIQGVEARLDVNTSEISRLEKENTVLMKELASFITAIESKR